MEQTTKQEHDFTVPQVFTAMDSRSKHIAALDKVTIKGHDGLITASGEDGNNPIVFLFTSGSNPDKKTEVQITFESLKEALLNRP